MNEPALISRQTAEIEQARTTCMYDRMKAIQERPGNPEGVKLERFDGALAIFAETMPWPQFNTVKGLGSEHLPLLDDIVSFYDRNGRSCRFEIAPDRCSGELLDALTERGYSHSAFHTVLAAASLPDDKHADFPADIEVRALEEAEMSLYGEIHCLGTGLPQQGIQAVTANNRVIHGRDGWQFYLGLSQGVPAAVGVMYTDPQTGIASLTFAATLPDYRGRGLQTALLRRRMYDAIAASSPLIIAETAFASPSHRNMERAGLKVAYTWTVWSKRR